VEATARPAARERGWGCGRPAALSFIALVGTGFKPAGWVNDGRSGRRLSFTALVGTGFKPAGWVNDGRSGRRLSFIALVGTGFKPAGWVNDGRSGRRLSFIALVGTGFNPVPTSVFLRQGAVATIHELLANIGSNPVPPSVFLRQTWRPPQGPQRGSGAGGAGDPQLCLSPRW